MSSVQHPQQVAFCSVWGLCECMGGHCLRSCDLHDPTSDHGRVWPARVERAGSGVNTNCTTVAEPALLTERRHLFLRNIKKY